MKMLKPSLEINRKDIYILFLVICYCIINPVCYLLAEKDTENKELLEPNKYNSCERGIFCTKLDFLKKLIYDEEPS